MSMFLAVKTTASPGEIWAIVVVAVVFLGVWLAGFAYVDKYPLWRHQRVPEMPGPVLGGMHVAAGGRSVAPNRDAPALLGDEDAAELLRGGEVHQGG